MYKTFTEWKNGHWLEDGEPRKEAYTKDELLLVEMGWKYGFDAGKAQQVDRIAKYEQVLQSIANEQVELSHDKIKWQCEDHIRWAREALK